MPIHKARLRISDYNLKRQASLKKKERRIQMVSLSLTSMVDMFAILVLYLLVGSSSVTQWLQLSHNIQLPTAKSAENPTKAATLQISNDTLYGDEVALTPLRSIASGPVSVEPLKAWLKTLNSQDGYINIMGDEKTSFGIMRRIVATCQQAGFKNVNLAIQPTN